MRSIYIVIIGILTTTALTAQISNDTTYSKEWNANTSTWVYFDRIITSFTGDQLESELIQVFENESWVNYNLVSFYYMNAQLIEEHEMYWNESKNVWEDNYRKLYSYNENNEISAVTHQYIFNGVYVNSSREVYKYDEQNRLVEKVVEKFEEAWTNFLKYQYYYNANDLIMEENLTYWEGENWGEVSFAVNHTYNKLNQLVSKEKSKTVGKKEKKLTREEYQFNTEGMLTGQVVSQWSNQKNKWINKNRAKYVNDLDGYIVTMLNQNKNKREWSNYLFTEFRGNNEPITGMDIAEGMSFSIYPVNYGQRAMLEFNNPYNEVYYVKIIDGNGNTLSAATTSKDEIAMDASRLIKGQYYIELQGRNLYSGKFSIE
ncbi:MAG: hypothetical protein K9G76_01530 [Bacteroidales bacterium]|nr:hypothetical protein [Bacteroidales bacterium]MCF8403234.1 hypothetical protein [Bacteroidales bacterium]